MKTTLLSVRIFRIFCFRTKYLYAFSSHSIVIVIYRTTKTLYYDIPVGLSLISSSLADISVLVYSPLISRLITLRFVSTLIFLHNQSVIRYDKYIYGANSFDTILNRHEVMNFKLLI